MAFDFDVIIIGSGFGATALALDQNAKNKRILILERGVWWLTPELSAENPMNPFLKARPQTQPVQYWPRPDHRGGVIDLLSVVKASGVLGGLQDFANGIADFFTGRKRPQPLYRYHTFDEADVLTASGVGGGSLIYSNVTLEPFFDTTTQQYPVMASWPAQARLAPADYAAALNWMTTKRGAPSGVVTKYPNAIPQSQLSQVNSSDPRLLGRARFLRDASTSATLPQDVKNKIVEPWGPLKLQIAEADPATAATNKNYCERQGRCFLGCLPAARHTLNKTLLKQLPLPAEDRVFVRPLAEVDFIEPLQGGGYTVHYKGVEDGNNYHPTAGTVVVAAGALGSTEILLRSRDKNQGKLVVSDRLGSRFSTNGDFSGFVIVDSDKLQYPIYGNRGPINMSHVTFRDGGVLVNVEDAGIPAMFASIVQQTLKMLAQPSEPSKVVGLMSSLWNKARLPDYSDPTTMQTESEMMMNICWFNCMGTDDATGTFDLHNGHLRLRFSQKIADHPTFHLAENILRGIATAMNGRFQAFPLWDGLQPFVSRKLVITHPLGGCPIGGSSTDGVVNAQGQVFDSQTGASSVHAGLFVADGSTIPGALAVNPTLSIVAQALRVAAAIP
ncbi:MAG TPA: GMC oxidoreductase [Vicinamibacterales bacterium]|nr:GMC oxidoreductase [Vicinamibacterales bacterium]